MMVSHFPWRFVINSQPEIICMKQNLINNGKEINSGSGRRFSDSRGDFLKSEIGVYQMISYNFSCFNFSNIAITSGCVGVNFTPRFNIPKTFFAFCSTSLAVCSLVSIK